MNECKGILGKLFGHNYQRYLVKSAHTLLRGYFYTGPATCPDEYKIICKRCGKEISNDN